MAVDAQGRSSIPGLYAAGECASAGMHGANRMAGNSLLEAVVLGRRAAAGLDRRTGAAPVARTDAEAPGRMLTHPDRSIPRLMWDGCGPFRDEIRLRGLIDALESLPAQLQAARQGRKSFRVFSKIRLHRGKVVPGLGLSRNSLNKSFQ